MISFLMPLRYKGKNYIYLRALEVIHYFETVALDVELVISDSSEMKLSQSICTGTASDSGSLTLLIFSLVPTKTSCP